MRKAAVVPWVQHPGFGAPFIDGHTRLSCGARTVVTDATAPGNQVPPDIVAAYPLVATLAGPVDVSRVPGPGSCKSLFVCLTDFIGAWFELRSPSAGFGLRFEWDHSLFPHAWLWHECHATPGYPWHSKAYVIGVEPANLLPGEPSPHRLDRGSAPALPAGEVWTSNITIRRISA